MLRGLQIENYALIKSLNIRFDSGFTVITGETGAGKSILMGALSLILGNRADSNVLYDKSKKCFVEAEFDIAHLSLTAFFTENDLDYDPHTTIRREILETGKSRAFVNDTPVTLQTLKTLGEHLVDIHSQHHHLLLKRGSFRLQVVDEFAQIHDDLSKYKELYSQFQKKENEYQQLLEIISQEKQQLSFLEYMHNELADAQLKMGEQEELEAKLTFFANTELIKSNLFEVNQLLSEQEGNVLEQIRLILQNYKAIVSFNNEIQQLEERLEVVFHEIKDIAYETAKIGDAVAINPEEIVAIRERLDVIYALQQKHHVTNIVQLLAIKEDFQQKLDDYFSHVELLHNLDDKRRDLKEKVAVFATQLSEKRKKIIPLLEKEIVSKLQLIGMEDAVFQINISNRVEPNEWGIDEVIYLFSANRGTSPVELERIASGGEISRVMLAIKSSITEKSLLPTVIFDEIDTGISGKIAGKVAQLMVGIGKQRQLLVITHIPQIAAKGNLHYHVYKNVEHQHTYTMIKQLNQEERAHEIAKMISGVNVTNSSVNAAKELMSIKS